MGEVVPFARPAKGGALPAPWLGTEWMLWCACGYKVRADEVDSREGLARIMAEHKGSSCPFRR